MAAGAPEAACRALRFVEDHRGRTQGPLAVILIRSARRFIGLLWPEEETDPAAEG